MAKRPSLDTQAEAARITQRTEPIPAPAEQPKAPKPTSVKLTAAELARLDLAAQEMGVKRHAALRYAVMYFLNQFEAGEIPLETETRKRPKGL